MLDCDNPLEGKEKDDEFQSHVSHDNYDTQNVSQNHYRNLKYILFEIKDEMNRALKLQSITVLCVVAILVFTFLIMVK